MEASSESWRTETPTSAAARLPGLDWLRAVAALAVLAFHASVTAAVPETSTFGQLVHRLNVGVAIFFVISGFVLYRPLLAASLDGRRANGLRFVKRRLLRILPAYWVALTLIAVLLPLSEVFQSWSSAVTYYGLLQIYSSEFYGGGLGVAWTLSVELSFYLLLPLFVYLVDLIAKRYNRQDRLKLHATAVFTLLAASLIYKLVLLNVTAVDSVAALPLRKSLPFFLDQFALGMALAVFANARNDNGRAKALLKPITQHRSALWCSAAAVYFIVATQIGLNSTEQMSQTQYLARHLLFAATAVLLVAPVALRSSAASFSKHRRYRPLIWLGTISYGVYLYHSVILTLLGRSQVPIADLGGYLKLVVLTLVISVAIATVSYLIVERPFIRLGRRSVRDSVNSRRAAADAKLGRRGAYPRQTTATSSFKAQ